MSSDLEKYPRDQDDNEIYPKEWGNEIYLHSKDLGYAIFARKRDDKEFYAKNHLGDELYMDQRMYITSRIYIIRNGQPIYAKLAHGETYYYSDSMSEYLWDGTLIETSDQWYFRDEKDNEVYRKSLKGGQVYATYANGYQRYAMDANMIQMYAQSDDQTEIYARDEKNKPYFAFDEYQNHKYAKDSSLNDYYFPGDTQDVFARNKKGEKFYAKNVNGIDVYPTRSDGTDILIEPDVKVDPKPTSRPNSPIDLNKQVKPQFTTHQSNLQPAKPQPSLQPSDPEQSSTLSYIFSFLALLVVLIYIFYEIY